MAPLGIQPVHVVAWALELLIDDVLKHFLVEEQIGDNLFQFAVFFIKQLQLLPIIGHEPFNFLALFVKRRIGNPCLPANLLNCRSLHNLPQKGDLLVAEFRNLLGRSTSEPGRRN